MAPPKGVTPPHLRKFLFKKGQAPPKGKGRSISKGARATKAASPGPAREKPKGQSMGKAKTAANSMVSKASEALGAPVRPIQMLLSGGMGYVLPKIFDRLGVAQAMRAVDGSGKVGAFFDKIWGENPGNFQAKAVGLSDGANQYLANVAGGLSFGKLAYDGLTKGKLDAKDVNFFGPFALGQYLDAPEGPIGVAGGSGALSGISGPSGPGNSTSPMGGCGWL